MKGKNYSIVYNKKSVKSLYKYDRILKDTIENYILSFVNSGIKVNNIKKLKGYENRYRLRIGKYRILFEKYKNKLIILVIDIGSRGDIYK